MAYARSETLNDSLNISTAVSPECRTDAGVAAAAAVAAESGFRANTVSVLVDDVAFFINSCSQLVVRMMCLFHFSYRFIYINHPACRRSSLLL